MANRLRDTFQRTAPWLLIVTVAALLAIASGTASFLVGQRMGARASPTAIATLTQPFPMRNTATATPRPTQTETATPTRTPVPTPTATFTPTPTPTPTPRVVIVEMRSLGRLETSTYLLETVIDLARRPENVWQQIFGTDQLLLVASGEVVAGFDLTKMESGDVEARGDQVRVVLPRPEILYSRIDNERTYVYERSRGLFRAPDMRIEGEARQLAEEAMRQRAVEGGILTQAAASGRLQVEGFLRTLGFVEVIVEIADE